MQFTTFALTALLGLASAQVKVHTVEVASSNNSLTFKPDTIKAAVGEMVQFQFLAGNHTVTQSTFDQPCAPISQSNSSIKGFHSGFVPAAASVSRGMIPTYTIQINSTTPVWVYCAQGKHCQAGMVMVINENTTANTTRSLKNYKAGAAKATTNTAPSTGTTNGTTGTTTTTTGSTTSRTAIAGGNLVTVPMVGAALVAAAGSLFVL